jgi:MOSC domain-containing protein YiiM
VLVANYGIEGDAKGGGTRQLNLMSAETVEALAGKGFQTAPGELGEQLIVAGLNLDALPCGTRLRIGAEASVELTEPRTGCAKFERHQGKTKGEAAGQMGVMARVLEGGAIAIGDPVSCVDP